MDEQRQQRINEAARRFTDALVGSYGALSERGISAQELNAALTQTFFNRVTENLRAQAEGTREMTQQLADQQQRQREAAQALTRESVGVYMAFVDRPAMLIPRCRAVLESRRRRWHGSTA